MQEQLRIVRAYFEAMSREKMVVGVWGNGTVNRLKLSCFRDSSGDEGHFTEMAIVKVDRGNLTRLSGVIRNDHAESTFLRVPRDSAGVRPLVCGF